MWPIAIIGLAVFAYAIGKGKSPVSTGNSRTDVGRKLPAAKPVETALQRLHKMIRKGRRPTEWLISEAVREAYNHGDYVLADKILSAFDKQESQPSSEAPVSPPPGDVASAVPAAATPGVPPAPEPRSYPSPIEHVPDDEWSMFANAMRIHEPDFETDRHVGAFHQRKDRLKQLRLEAGKDEESQYRAFVADCLNHMEQKTLINEHVTSIVKIGPDEHVVTASGLLGLMKAAGPKNAVHWITHPDEQEKFPKTTDIFIRCNGIF